MHKIGFQYGRSRFAREMTARRAGGMENVGRLGVERGEGMPDGMCLGVRRGGGRMDGGRFGWAEGRGTRGVAGGGKR